MTAKTKTVHWGMQSPRLMAGLLLAVLVGGALLAWWSVRQADQEMRATLLKEARMVVQAVNVESVRAFTGTRADERSPDYQRLKEQMVTLRAANPQYRFVYLLGRKPDESLFFYVDSEPVGSKDYSWPGQIYGEATDTERRVFATRTAEVEGPSSDRWGTWVSALVPVLDPQTAMYGLATPRDAQEMVRKAVDFYRRNGRERLLEEINNPRGEFHRGDLYAFAYDRQMTWLAHPVTPALVGQNWIDRKDWSGGKYFRREIQKVALGGHGWVGFEYLNPLNGQHDHKTTYVEGVDDLIICSGAYKGDGEICAVLGMDVDGRTWGRQLVRSALLPAFLTLAVGIVLAISSVLLARRARLAGTPPRWMWNIEPAMAAATGLVLTLVVIWIVHRREIDDRNEAFQQLAASRTAAVANTLHDIRTAKVESLARFYECSEQVTTEEFQQYVGYLEKNPAVQGWAWVSAVPASDRAGYEAAFRSAGRNGFGIWQKDEQGNPVPAADRPFYYPVSQAAPLSGNAHALGFDQGSEPQRRLALEAAMRTGLPTSTGLIDLVLGTSPQKGMLVYRPVFDGAGHAHLRGFALAVLQLGALLKRGAPDGSALMDLALVHPDGSSELLTTTNTSEAPTVAGLSVTRPIFAFGKVFTVTAHAGPEFERLYPVQGGWMAGMSGGGLSIALAIVIGMVLQRRQELERLVLKRTSELQESEQAYRDQFARNSAVMLLIDPQDGTIVDANVAAAEFYGYQRERLLAMRITDINLLSAQEIQRAYSSIRQDQGRQFVFQHRLADGSLRDVEVSASRIQFGDCVILHSIVFDITARKKAEHERAVLARQLEGVNLMQEVLLKPTPLDDKLFSVADGVVRYFNADFCRIWIIRPGDLCGQGCRHAEAREGEHLCPRHDKCLHLLAGSGRNTHLKKGHGRVPLGCYKIGQIASGEEHKFLIQDVVNDPDVQDRDWARGLGLVSFAGYQLRVPGGESIGVLGFFSKHPILPSEDTMLDGLSTAVALTVQQTMAKEALQRANEELELRVKDRTVELTQANDAMRGEISERRKAEAARLEAQAERDAAEAQLRQAQKLEAIGQLAAGIAHEINTPAQFVSDNTHFVQQSFKIITDVHSLYDEMLEAVKTNTVTPDLVSRVEAAAAAGDLGYLFKEIPEAIGQTLEGIARISKIVCAMKEFSHPGSKTKGPANLNKAIESTATVAHNEWKYVADLKLDLDPELPLVMCFVSDFNQAVLNLIVNAAHAIGDVVQKTPGAKGTIMVSTRREGEAAVVRVSDTGTGIPEEIRPRMFELFFTTKGVGKGTGQGLAMVYSAIVKRHGGTVTFESEVGKGTTFILRLPLEPVLADREV
jgi:PAS domain S-box-containing protein